MSFIEFLGFVISIAAMGFLMVRRFLEERRRRQNPEKYAEDEEHQDEALKEFLRSINVDVNNEVFAAQEERRIATPPRPPVKSKTPSPQIPVRSKNEKYRFSSQLENQRSESRIEKRQLKSTIEERHLSAFETRIDPFLQSAADPYTIIKLDPQPRIQKLIKSLPALQQAIILREIIGPPKGLQNLE